MRRSCAGARKARVYEPGAGIQISLRREAVADARVRLDVARLLGSGSSLRRRFAMCTRSTWVSSSYATPQTSVSSARWVISRPRFAISARSSSNSVGVRWTSSPSRRDAVRRRGRPRARPPTRPARRASGAPGAAPRAAARPARRAERLGHVVVRAGVERAHLLGLLAHRGQHEDRHLAPLPDRRGDLDAVAVGQDEVDDRRVRRLAPPPRRAPPPRSPPARPRSPRRAGSPAARAGSAARRRRRAPGRATSLHSLGRAVRRPGTGSWKTKLVPCPGSDSARSRPPFASTNPRAIASPSPEPPPGRSSERWNGSKIRSSSLFGDARRRDR